MPCGGCVTNCKCSASQCCQTCKCDTACNCACKKSTTTDASKIKNCVVAATNATNPYFARGSRKRRLRAL